MSTDWWWLLRSCRKCGGAGRLDDALCGECRSPAVAQGQGLDTSSAEARFAPNGLVGEISIPGGSPLASTSPLSGPAGVSGVNLAARGPVPNETYIGSRLSYRRFENFDPLEGCNV